MNTFFKEVAKEKAKQMYNFLKNKNTVNSVTTYELEVNVLNGLHKYELEVKANWETKKHKSLSYKVKGIDNTYFESCDMLSF